MVVLFHLDVKQNRTIGTRGVKLLLLFSDYPHHLHGDSYYISDYPISMVIHITYPITPSPWWFILHIWLPLLHGDSYYISDYPFSMVIHITYLITPSPWWFILHIWLPLLHGDSYYISDYPFSMVIHITYLIIPSPWWFILHIWLPHHLHGDSYNFLSSFLAFLPRCRVLH